MGTFSHLMYVLESSAHGRSCISEYMTLPLLLMHLQCIMYLCHPVLNTNARMYCWHITSVWVSLWVLLVVIGATIFGDMSEEIVLICDGGGFCFMQCCRVCVCVNERALPLHLPSLPVIIICTHFTLVCVRTIWQSLAYFDSIETLTKLFTMLWYSWKRKTPGANWTWYFYLNVKIAYFYESIHYRKQGLKPL